MSRIILVLGGARSGKSRYAERLALRHRGRKAYIATAEAFDDEMRARIAWHRQRRGDGWETSEAPLELAGALAACTADFVLVDCLTVWLGNLLHHGREPEAEVGLLCDALKQTRMRVVIVSNEVGLGIVPDNPPARAFRDVQGLANQAIARLADEVIFMAAGLPMVVKRARRRPAPARGAG